MFKFSQLQYTQYIRIVIYWLAGAFGMTAFANSSTGQMIVVGIISLATLLWTMYATRIAAKINDLLGAGVVEIMVTKDAELANSIDSSKVVSIDNVQDPQARTETSQVQVTPK